jgi:predicted dehydrogenase
MASNPIRVGLIGLGFIGKVHAHAYNAIPHCFSSPKALADLCAILRTSTGKDQALLQSLGNPKVTTNEKEFYEQGLDMVDVCTPNALHLEQVSAALEEGLHVYCEKPLGANQEQARKLNAAANKAGVLTHTAFSMRYYPAARQAKAILAAGALGEIYNFRAHLFHNSYMDAGRPMAWRLQKDISGGGTLADLGVHMFDLVRYLLGEADWVQCRTRTFITSRPKAAGSSEMAAVDVDDWALCTMELQSGAQGVVEVTRMSGGITDTNSIQIFGSQGSLEIDFRQPSLIKFFDQKNNQTISGPLDFPIPEGERPINEIYPPAKLSLGDFTDAHMACILDFLLNINEKRPSGVNFESALRSQEILEAAYLSAERHTDVIHLPLP